MTDFSSIAPSYRKDSLVQASAGEMLLALLGLQGDEDVLDVGCGAGNLTALLRTKTSGRMVGVDREAGMLSEARASYGEQGIEFLLAEGGQLTFAEEFDCLFCNSVFQWFPHPARSLTAFHRALRPSGRAGVQAPATGSYCPNFLQAIEHCRGSSELDNLLAGFRSPWFFLDSAEEYRILFEAAGFRVDVCRIEPFRTSCSIDKAAAVFKSGAAAGYLNQACFSEALPPNFAERVLTCVRESFAEQADDEGIVELVFNRLYVLAGRE